MAKILVNASLAQSLYNFRGPLIREMCAQGHAVHATAPAISDEDADCIRALGATPHEVPLERNGLGPFSDLNYLLALWRLIGELAPDRLLNYTIKPNIWGSIAGRMRGVATTSMVTGLGYMFAASTTWKQRGPKAIARRLYGIALQSNQSILFQNPDDVRDFAEAVPSLDLDKVHMINGSGVDLGHYAPAPLPDQPVFLMIARLLGAKGIREYAAACAILKQHCPDAQCLLVGMTDDGPDGVSEAEVRKLCAGSIDFLGSMADVRPAIARANVYVLPSYREGTPRSTLEAMAMGRAVVTTDVPGCRETVAHGENGLLVPVRDVAALGAAMIELAQSADLRQVMGSKSLALAQTRFAVDKVNNKIIDALNL